MTRFVIRYTDGAYDQDGGWPVNLHEATTYSTWEEARKVVRESLDDDCAEVVPLNEVEETVRPYTPAEWEAGIEGLTAPRSVLERLEATIRALAWRRET